MSKAGEAVNRSNKRARDARRLIAEMVREGDVSVKDGKVTIYHTFKTATLQDLIDLLPR